MIGILAEKQFWQEQPALLTSLGEITNPRDVTPKQNGHDEHVGRNEAKSDLALRTVQFFDSVSLWLCCAERHEPERVVAPTGESLTLIPETAYEIALDPYPLADESLRLQSPARRIAARSYKDEADYRAAFNAAPVEFLNWTISRR